MYGTTSVDNYLSSTTTTVIATILLVCRGSQNLLFEFTHYHPIKFMTISTRKRHTCQSSAETRPWSLNAIHSLSRCGGGGGVGGEEQAWNSVVKTLYFRRKCIIVSAYHITLSYGE